VRTANILRLSADLPMIVEIIDSEEAINRFLPTLKSMVQDGLITLEEVRILHYGSGQDDPASPG